MTEAVEEQTRHALVLELEGDRQEFEAWREANQFLLVEHIDNLGAPGIAGVIGMTKLVQGQVKPWELDRLNAYLARHGHADDYLSGLDDGLSACWKGETHLPLEPSSSSSAATSSPELDSSSTPDSQEPEAEEQSGPKPFSFPPSSNRSLSIPDPF